MKLIHEEPSCVKFGLKGLTEIIEVVAELRQIKDDYETVLFQYAWDTNSQGARDIFKQAHSDMFEHQVEAILAKKYIDNYCMNYKIISVPII